ncbi:hypothetical protein CYD63_28935, partial [Klebsiella pneumoniae]
FICFLFSAPQVIHRLAVKFLDLVFKILFLILVLGAKFINKINMLQWYMWRNLRYMWRNLRCLGGGI